MTTPATTYEERVLQVLSELGVPESYGRDRGMPLCSEAVELVSIGQDIYGREQKLSPRAAEAWHALRSAAERDGVVLGLVSAFRSLEYQKQIWRRKLDAGEKVDHILGVNAPPGYSEHHTGRAIDLTTPGCRTLSEEFENTPAFSWLARRAEDFGFTLSYPRRNKSGISYEPWHWAFRET